MKITKGFSGLMPNGEPAPYVWPIQGDNRVPVVLLTAADFERIVEALRLLRDGFQIPHARCVTYIATEDQASAAAEIVKEIGET